MLGERCPAFRTENAFCLALAAMATSFCVQQFDRMVCRGAAAGFFGKHNQFWGAIGSQVPCWGSTKEWAGTKRPVALHQIGVTRLSMESALFSKVCSVGASLVPRSRSCPHVQRLPHVQSLHAPTSTMTYPFPPPPHLLQDPLPSASTQ